MKYVKTALLLLAIAILGVTAEKIHNVGAYSWNSCGTDDDIFHMYDVTLSPDPIVLPGDLVLNINFTSTQDAPAPIKLSVKLSKKIDGLWADVPCIGDIGSCDYEDICYDLDRLFPPTEPCPDIFLIHDIPCNCPIKAGDYVIKDLTIPLPSTTETEIVDGDFHLQITLTSGDITQLTCVDIYATLYAQQ